MSEEKLREKYNIVKGYLPVTDAISGFFAGLEVRLKNFANYRYREEGGEITYSYDRSRAQAVIREEGRAVFLGDVGIGKTSITIQEAISFALSLGKIPVFTNQLLARYGKEKLEEILVHMAKQPEKYFFITFVSLGMSAREELSGIPLLDTKMPMPMSKELDVYKEAYGIDHAAMVEMARKIGSEIIEQIKADKGIAATPVTLPTLPLPLDILTKSGIWGILIIDDITNHKHDEDLINFIASILGARKVSGISSVELSPYVIVVGTGNLREHSKIAYDLPPNMAGRATVYTVSMPSKEEVEKYLLKTASMIRAHKKVLYSIIRLFRTHENILTGRKVKEYQYAMDTPRAWERTLIESSKWMEVFDLVRSGKINSIIDRPERLAKIKKAFSEQNIRRVLRNIFVTSTGRDDLVDKYIEYIFKDIPEFQEVFLNPTLSYNKYLEAKEQDIDIVFAYGLELGNGIASLLKKYVVIDEIVEEDFKDVTIFVRGNKVRKRIDELEPIDKALLNDIIVRKDEEKLRQIIDETDYEFVSKIMDKAEAEKLGELLSEFIGKEEELADLVLGTMKTNLLSSISDLFIAKINEKPHEYSGKNMLTAIEKMSVALWMESTIISSLLEYWKKNKDKININTLSRLATTLEAILYM